MPYSAPKPCTCCGVLVRTGGSRCPAHEVREGTFADARRGTRQQRGYGAEWEKTRKRILKRDKGICQPCKREGHIHAGNIVDHILNKARGGTDDDGNLETICKAAHQRKTQGETRGGRKSGPATDRTDGGPKFLRAQVAGVGGVKPVAKVWSF